MTNLKFLKPLHWTRDVKNYSKKLFGAIVWSYYEFFFMHRNGGFMLQFLGVVSGIANGMLIPSINHALEIPFDQLVKSDYYKFFCLCLFALFSRFFLK